MQFSEQWKSLFPISLLHSPPLLLLNRTELGPLLFNPVPETVTNIVPSLTSFTPLLPPPPSVPLARFIENTTLYDPVGAVLHTSANAIGSSFGPHGFNAGYCDLLQSCIVPLRCPNDWVIVFFPTGDNLDSVGFVVLGVKDGNVGFVDCGYHDAVFTSSIKFNHRITRLVACRLIQCDESLGYVGFLAACTMYGVHWFRVRISGLGSKFERPVLDYVGSKNFRSGVAHACWNPYFPGECVVLLESGALFLVDMESPNFRVKRMSIEWNKLGVLVEDGWFSCEFSWHPRILIVANSKAVFLVDFRLGKCQPCRLLAIEMLGMYTMSDKDKLVAFSKAGNDGFFFTVASTEWLFLCDVRKPLMPVLRWSHNLHKPCYMVVSPLSELRSHPAIEKYERASEEGFGVILGSLWDNEFSLFCYGHPISASTQSSKFSDSFYAWEHPSELCLSGHCCGCGDCLLKEDLMKNDLPEWIPWQQKKELVLGFFILDQDLSSSLPGPGEHGGFTLVRLMSSGKLETQQYCASWKLARTVSTTCHEVTPHSKDTLLCDMGDDEYKFTKKFEYVKLEYLFAHLNNDLTKSLFSKFKNTYAIGCADECSSEFREFMIKKLNSFGCAPPISYLSPSDVFNDVNTPTSLYEIVSRLMWINLPMTSLEMAFIPHRNSALEFLKVPDQDQAPPFFLKMPSHYYGSKRSSKIKHGSDFVGPVVPLHALLVLYEISKNGHSFASQVNDYLPETSVALKCKPVVRLAKDLGITYGSNEQDEEDAVSLGNDKEDDPRSLFLYGPSAFSNELPYLDGEDPVNFLQEREMLISKIAKSKHLEAGEAPKLFGELCLVELKFNSDNQAFDHEEMKSYGFLKKQFSQWQHGFHPYQNLYDRLKQ